MNPIVLCTIATAFFALGNVITEQKFSQIDQLSYIMGWTSIVFCWSAIMRFLVLPAYGAQPVALAEQPFSLWFVLMATLFFVGNYLVITAFTSGGHVVMLAAVALVGPAFAAAFRLLWVLELPNRYIVIGYLLCAAGIAVMMYGSQQQTN